MKPNQFWKDLRAAVTAIFATLAILAALLWLQRTARAQVLSSAPSSISQASAAVSPRQWVIFNGLLTPNQTLTNGTNASATFLTYLTNNFGSNVASYLFLTNQSVYAAAPTFLSTSVKHFITLTAVIAETNVMAHASNMAVVVYPAYDLGGGSSNTVSQRYGAIFGTNDPLLTWNISYQTNGVYVTNIPDSAWDGATALGYTITNGINSNVNFTLIQGNTP